MKAPGSLWIARLLKLALAVLALAFLGVYLFIVFHRIRYPYELEWMEGAHVDYVRRILAGKPIYIQPSVEFTPFIYTPLYFYVSALVARFTGFGLPGRGFFPLRLVSVLSSLGAFLVIYLLVKRETGSRFAGVVAGCLLAATFQIAGGFADTARLDSLFLFLLLLAVYTLRRARSPAGFALAGLLVFLSFFTKQTALFISLPLMIWAVWTNRRGGLVFVTTAAALVIGSTLVFDHISHGWYRYYVFLLPGQHVIVREMLVGFWTQDILTKLFVPVALAIIFLAASLRRADRRAGWFYLALVVGMLGGSWMSRLNEGGVENVLTPAYAGLCILLGLGVDALVRQAGKAEEELQHWLRAGIYVICLAQFAFLWYSPARHLPTAADREAWDGFMRRLSEMPGEVLLVHHGYLPSLVGKPTHAHMAAAGDVMRHHKGTVDDLLIAEFEQAMKSDRFSAVILDAGDLPPGLGANYHYVERVFARDDVAWPVTGRRVRPERILVPVEQGSP